MSGAYPRPARDDLDDGPNTVVPTVNCANMCRPEELDPSIRVRPRRAVSGQTLGPTRSSVKESISSTVP